MHGWCGFRMKEVRIPHDQAWLMLLPASRFLGFTLDVGLYGPGGRKGTKPTTSGEAQSDSNGMFITIACNFFMVSM